MASSKEFLAFVKDSFLSEEITFRPMMGEYVMYYSGKVVGGIYDDRVLLKATRSALALLKEEGAEPQWEVPYDGAKQMIAADPESEQTIRLIRAIAADLEHNR